MKRFVGIAMFWLAATSALADDSTPTLTDDGTWSFQVENDLFAKGRTDRYYSNGLRLLRSGEMQDLLKVKDEGLATRHLLRTAGLLCEWSRCDRSQASVALDIHGGQNMYTPQNLLRPDAYPYDRPYAGWLYLGARTHLADSPVDGEASRLQSLDLIIGIVGPAAGAGRVQRAWHELIDATAPQGWSHQLKNEPTLQASLTTMHRYSWIKSRVDTLPYWRLTLGNVFTHAAAGAHLRVGPQLGGFASFDPAPTAAPVMSRARSPVNSRVAKPKVSPGLNSSWHVFAAFEVRAVARNIFIDGNSFRDHPSPSHVSHRPLVGDVALGFSIPFLDQWRLTYGHVWRSREFKLDQLPARGNPPPSAVQRYGVVNIQYEPR